jgi:Skp family chaperone for outer membrane proteins
MKFKKIGLIGAALMLGAFAAVGFQGSGDKFGIVDVEKVFNDSAFAKTQTESLRKMGAARQDLLQFVATNRTITAAQAASYRTLALKENPSATDQAEMTRIKNDVKTSETQFQTLTTKTNPTAAELQTVQDLNKRRDETDQLLAKWQQEFSDEVDAKRTSLRAEALAKVRQAIQKTAREQGCTVVFDSSVAPYAANDLTDASVKAMN